MSTRPKYIILSVHFVCILHFTEHHKIAFDPAIRTSFPLILEYGAEENVLSVYKERDRSGPYLNWKFACICYL